jgi:hypothetical protein
MYTYTYTLTVFSPLFGYILAQCDLYKYAAIKKYLLKVLMSSFQKLAPNKMIELKACCLFISIFHVSTMISNMFRISFQIIPMLVRLLLVSYL